MAAAYVPATYVLPNDCAWPSMFVCEKCDLAKGPDPGDLRKHTPQCNGTNNHAVTVYGEIKVRWIKVKTTKYKNPQPFAVPVCTDCRGTINSDLAKHVCYMKGDHIVIHPDLKSSARVKRQYEELHVDDGSNFE